MLHVLNTIGSRKLVLEAELKEIDEDIAQNTAMGRKYGDDFFTEGSARLAQTRVGQPRCCDPLLREQSLLAVPLILLPPWPTAGRKAAKVGRD